jgi:hypothetical protein
MRAYLKHEALQQLEAHAVLKRAQALAKAETAAVLSQVHPGARRAAAADTCDPWLSRLDEPERADLAKIVTRHDRDLQALKIRACLRRESAADAALDQFTKSLGLRLAKSALAYFEQPAPPDLLTQAVAEFQLHAQGDVLLCAL